jgi:hypothetical protein
MLLLTNDFDDGHPVKIRFRNEAHRSRYSASHSERHEVDDNECDLFELLERFDRDSSRSRKKKTSARTWRKTRAERETIAATLPPARK